MAAGTKAVAMNPDPLVERIGRSDAAAFGELFESINRPLVRYIQGFTRDVATAYDVLQDVFAKLWEIRETLPAETKLSPLLYTMARNRALNVIRKHSRYADLDLTEESDHFTVDISPDVEYSANELERNLGKWIGELPPRRAEAFMLARYHGLSHAEIGKIMNLSERTVQTHLVHALRDLRTKMKSLQG